MVPSARPIKNIHVSAFDGSRSLWSRWITHASDYRFRPKRLQMPSGNPHCTVYTPHQGPEMVSSAPALPLRSLPSFRHLVIWPLRRAFHTTTPSSSPHRHALSSTSAPHPLLLWARAPHRLLRQSQPSWLILAHRGQSADKQKTVRMSASMRQTDRDIWSLR